jgi:hypothetical protein
MQVQPRHHSQAHPRGGRLFQSGLGTISKSRQGFRLSRPYFDLSAPQLIDLLGQAKQLARLAAWQGTQRRALHYHPLLVWLISVK